MKRHVTCCSLNIIPIGIVERKSAIGNKLPLFEIIVDRLKCAKQYSEPKTQFLFTYIHYLASIASLRVFYHFRSLNFQMHFLEWNCMNFARDFTKFGFYCSKWLYSSIGSVNGLALTRRTWYKDVYQYHLIYKKIHQNLRYDMTLITLWIDWGKLYNMLLSELMITTVSDSICCLQRPNYE